MSTKLRVKQPRVLEQEGETSSRFKNWTTSVLSFFGQDSDFEQFLPGGRYSAWTAANSSARGDKGRLTTLFVKTAAHGDDYDCDRITDGQVKKEANEGDAPFYAEMDQAAKQEVRRTLERNRLRLRNKQLATMLGIMASLVYDSQGDSVVKDSTSMEWIFTYLRKLYNIDTRGVNFLRIVKVSYKPGTNHQIYYQELRAAYVDNLRKAGDAKNHLKPGDLMETDEVLSPSFEDAIVLKAIENIDARLPARVARDYEHRLDRHTHLIDLAASIFQAVPTMLESLDREAGLNALAASASAVALSPQQIQEWASSPLQVSSSQHQVALKAAAFAASYGRGRGRGGKGKMGSGPVRGSGGAPRMSATTGRPWTTKFCRLCENAKKSPSVVASHDTVFCDSFSKAELRSMLASLQAMTLSPNNEDFEVEDPENGVEGDGEYGLVQEEFTQGLQDPTS